MRLLLTLVLAMVLAPIAAAPPAHAQDAPVYIVSYIDAAPANRGTVVGMLRQLAIASRKDAGNMRFEILQRIAPSNQFAIVSIWKDQKSYDAHVAAAHSKEFRDKAKPFLISAIDDRAAFRHGDRVAGGGRAARGDLCGDPCRRSPAEEGRLHRRAQGTGRRQPQGDRLFVSRSSSRAAARTISRWSRSGRTRAPTTPTSPPRIPRSSATSSRR